MLFNRYLIIIGIIGVGLLTIGGSMCLLVDWIGLLVFTCDYKYACNELYGGNISAIVQYKLIEIW